MNAIISLCHFCELHGPRIIFCTQPKHPKEPEIPLSDESLPYDSGFQSLQGQRLTSPVGGAQISSEPQTPTSSSQSSFKSDLCEGCYSTHTGFVSHDEDAEVSYVSNQHPDDREVFSLIRQACLRSLSFENCQGQEGPIFYGDDQQGHVISYTFHIKDSNARGFQRRYSILVVMMDKIYLLNSWPFLVPHLKYVAEHLKNKAQTVHDTEQAKCPQKSYRIASSGKPAHFFQQRGGNKPARSLIELTDDRHIFDILHVSFVWILKATGNRISETLLEGPPTEDSIIDMEKQEETEEGFIKLFSKKAEDWPDQNEMTSQDGKMFGEEEFYDPNIPVIQNLRHLLKVLGIEKFHTVAHHVVIGNQIIIVGEHKQMVISFISALKCLLPKGCCRVIDYSETYQESWKCNFLGLSLSVDLPTHMVNSEMYLLIRILPEQPQCIQQVDLSDFETLPQYQFVLRSSVNLPDKAPTVLSKMEIALKNNNLNNDVVEQCLICLKEEWMNKVKVLFKFTKAGGNRSEDDTKKLLQIVNAQDEDKCLLKFWMTGLSVQYRNHILTASISKQSPS